MRIDRIMTDEWCRGEELFPVSPFGECQTLDELVEGLAAKKVASFDANTFKNSIPNDVQLVPCVIKKKHLAPKILKKKSSFNKIPKETSVKHVTFEVEQLLVREGMVEDRSAARDRLVVSLGGKEPKGRAVNYKVFKEEQKERKSAQSKRSAEVKAVLRANMKNKKKKKK
ncbi:hypothetical protein KIN20_006251 [Parelaphostrongylus tenuis]|uniref:Uncharacterized protein n=1 Tax=Parelaphostrongylus tenuis TaxID=148309 RepID=A0AAD5QFV0_PARTN|nr:hypothetical protein KIN20_006251 [Parelaphostrongylus tenuis]